MTSQPAMMNDLNLWENKEDVQETSKTLSNFIVVFEKRGTLSM